MPLDANPESGDLAPEPVPFEPAAKPPPGPARGSRRRRTARWFGVAAVVGCLLVGGHALYSKGQEPGIRRASSPPPRRVSPQPRPVTGPPALSHELVGPPEQPEMPTVLVGPPAPPEPHLAAVPALPPAVAWPPGSFPNLPGAGPAEPTAIIPRGGGDGEGLPILGNGGLGGAAGGLLPLTSARKPLGLRLQLEATENTAYGPGRWLRVRASTTAPCYVSVLHVDARRMVSLVFPRRFDRAYRPASRYTLAVREESPATAQFVFAVASVFPLTAADALALLESQPPAAEPPGARQAWEAVVDHLRGRATGPASASGWPRHAWKSVIAVEPGDPRLQTGKPGPELPDPTVP